MKQAFKYADDATLIGGYFLGPAKTRKQQQAIEKELIRRGYGLDNFRAQLLADIYTYMNQERYRLPKGEIKRELENIEIQKAGLVVQL